MWLAIESAMGTDLGGCVSVRVRLGLSSPNKNNCLSLALAFRIYHSASNDYLQRFLGYSTNVKVTLKRYLLLLLKLLVCVGVL